MKAFSTTLSVIFLGGLLLWSGCHREEPESAGSPQPQTSPNPAIRTNPPPPFPPTPVQISPAEGIEQVQEAFAQSPAETREKIDQAVAAIHAGNTREAIGRLKMVDAESSLDTNQVEAIKNLIRAVR